MQASIQNTKPNAKAARQHTRNLCAFRVVCLRFRRRASALALVHNIPVDAVLDRLRRGPERDAKADTKERQTARAGREVAVVLEYDGEAGKERVECPVHNRDIYRKYKHDGLGDQEY